MKRSRERGRSWGCLWILVVLQFPKQAKEGMSAGGMLKRQWRREVERSVVFSVDPFSWSISTPLPLKALIGFAGDAESSRWGFWQILSFLSPPFASSFSPQVHFMGLPLCREKAGHVERRQPSAETQREKWSRGKLRVVSSLFTCLEWFT